MRFTVDTRAMRQAFEAVASHADPDIDALARVRVEVEDDEITISATNGLTAAMALVEITDNLDGEMGRFDLSPVDVRKLLTLFKVGKEDFDAHLEVAVTAEHVEVTDIAGLFAGQALTLPATPLAERFPNVPSALAETIARHAESAPRILASGRLLTLFGKASNAYGYPLVLDQAGTNERLLITCGPAFAGLLYPSRFDEDESLRINRWHMDWLKRLTERVPF